MDLIDRVYGFNPYDLQIAAYRGLLDDALPDIPREIAGHGVCMFLKAPAGTITELRPVSRFSGEELAMYITASAGQVSQPASSYLTRNGILEYFVRESGPEQAEAVQRRVAELAAIRTAEVFAIAADGPA